ncbi:hypothetical protein Tco_0904449 [Tanacetum coccineum]
MIFFTRMIHLDHTKKIYIAPHNHSLTDVTQTTDVLEVITLNKQRNPLAEVVEGMLTRSMAAKLTASFDNECLFVDFLSKIEPKRVSKELKHLGSVEAMQEELNQFYRNKVWTLVSLLRGKISIGSKWVFMNKKDKLGTVIRNKARLANPKESHLIAIKRIFMYLKGTPTLGLWCLSIAQRKVGVLECKETPVIVDHPTPPTGDSEARPLKESNIKFTVKNGKTPLLLDYRTFCQTTCLEYNNGNYVLHPSTEEVKAKLTKIFAHEPVAKSIISCGLKDPDDFYHSGPRWEPLIYRTV